MSEERHEERCAKLTCSNMRHTASVFGLNEASEQMGHTVSLNHKFTS